MFVNNNKQPQALTSSLLKLYDGSTHRDETCMYAYSIISMTITCFHEDHILLMPQAIFLNYFFTP